jgi:hypothetical protein
VVVGVANQEDLAISRLSVDMSFERLGVTRPFSRLMSRSTVLATQLLGRILEEEKLGFGSASGRGRHNEGKDSDEG